MVVDAIESLLPYTKMYASELDDCVSNTNGGVNFGHDTNY